MARSSFVSSKYAIGIAFLVVMQVLLFVPAQAVAAGEKDAAMHKSALELVDVGNALYGRGMYSAAEQSLLKASENKQYLSESEQKKLTDLLEKAHAAVIERHKAFEQIKAAEVLAKEKNYAAASARLNAAKNNPYLSKGEREQIETNLKEIQANAKQQNAEMTSLYQESVKQFNAGQFEKARAGFAQVAASGITVEGLSAKDYLAKITNSDTVAKASAEPKAMAVEDELLNQPDKQDAQGISANAEPMAQPVQNGTANSSAPVNPAPAPVTIESTYIDRVLQQRNIQKSYTEAIVNDAIIKSKNQAASGQFEAARETLSSASRVVENNKNLLGDDAYNNFSSLLLASRNELEAKAGQSAAIEQRSQQQQAVALQQQLRTQQETERQQRIDDLMTKAIALQNEQRYDDSLAQLDLLLAIDPLNQQAKVMHKILTDAINYRKQIDTKADQNKETLETLLNADRATVPNSNEITYPKTWRELVNKRGTEEMAGMSPADAAVYKLLSEKTVDLSRLNPDMTFADALETLSASVDPRLNIVVIWRDLEETADITRTTKINMEGISAISLGKALDLLLNSVSGGLVPLGYVVEDGVITIATKQSLPTKLVQRMYDITDLLTPAAAFETDLTQTNMGQTQQVGGTGGGGSSGSSQQSRSSSTQNQQETGPAAMATRVQDIVTLIQETIDPTSWYTAGGEGTLQIYGLKRLIVNQTPEVHRKVAKLITDLRSNLGQQVSIEARFLLVDENFLEDIGVDADFRVNAGSHWQPVIVQQQSINNASPSGTRVPTSLAGTTAPAGVITTGYGGILDDLQVNFLITATQSHRNSTSLEAPRVTVLSGESATFNIITTKNYISDIEFEQSSTTGDNPVQFVTANRTISAISTGAILNVTPTITADKKYVLLTIATSTTELLSLDEFTASDFSSGQDVEASFFVPTTETTSIQTRVSVPDSGTLLLGGQKLTQEVDKESGIPILNKIPFVSRLFSNRSKVKDQRVLLILVTPTIILQDEREAEAIAGLKQNGL